MEKRIDEDDRTAETLVDRLEAFVDAKIRNPSYHDYWVYQYETRDDLKIFIAQLLRSRKGQVWTV